jgi:CRP-like cAMP-binding protein
MSLEISDDELREFLKHNYLFSDFSDRQMTSVLPHITILTFQKGDILINENEISDNIFIVKEGEVDVSKWDSGLNRAHHIATLGPNSVIGEMTLLDNAPRSASVVALDTTVILHMSRKGLYSESDEKTIYSKVAAQLIGLAQSAQKLISEPPFLPLMIENLAKGLVQRVRMTNDTVIDALRNDLRHAKAQVAMGLLIVSVLTMVACYMIVLKVLEEIHAQVSSTSLVTVPVMIVFTVATFYIIRKSGYPLQLYGITFNDWRKSLIESLLMTLVLIAVTIVIKYFFIEHIATYAHRALFDGEILVHKFPAKTQLFILIVYLLFVPLQELVVRGLLQSSFEEFLTGAHKTLQAIFLSNLLFSVSHFHFPIIVASVVFFTGLFWGWLYSRHHTLVGVILSHQCIGVWGLFVLGI